MGICFCHGHDHGWAGVSEGRAPSLPTAPHSYCPTTLSPQEWELGSGIGLSPHLLQFPGCIICSSSLPRRGGINNSQEMNNLSKVKGKRQVSALGLGRGFNEGEGTVLGEELGSG